MMINIFEHRRCPCCGKFMSKRSSVKWKSRLYCKTCNLFVYDRSEFADTYIGQLFKEKYQSIRDEDYIEGRFSKFIHNAKEAVQGYIYTPRNMWFN